MIDMVRDRSERILITTGRLAILVFSISLSVGIGCHIADATDLQRKAQRQFAEGDFSGAESAWIASVALLAQDSPVDRAAMATAFNGLSWAFLEQGKGVEAITASAQSLRLWGELGDTPQVARALGQLAEAYRSDGQMGKATGWAEQSLAIREQLPAITPVELANSKALVADLYRAGDAYLRDPVHRQRVLQLYEESLRLTRNALGEGSNEVRELVKLVNSTRHDIASSQEMQVIGREARAVFDRASERHRRKH